MKKKILVGSFALAGLLSGLSLANASTLTELGVGASPAVWGTSGANSATGSATFGGFTVIDTAAGGDAPPATGLTSTNIDVKASGAGSLDLWATITGLTTATGIQPWISGFTTNLLPTSTWTITEKTWLDPLDAAFGTTILLGSAVLTSSLTTAGNIVGANAGLGPYSLTEEFIINATGAGASTNTISAVSTTPLPAALPLFAGGLGVLGFAGLRKKRKKSAVITA